MICDMCIVHLNVSYNLKRQAVDNDMKLRQYLIEKGLGSNETETNPTSIIYSSNISVIQNPNTRMCCIPMAIKTEVMDEDFNVEEPENIIEEVRDSIDDIVVINNTTKRGRSTKNHMKSSMVIVNDNSLLSKRNEIDNVVNKTTASSCDNEFVSNYISSKTTLTKDKKNLSETPPSTSSKLTESSSIENYKNRITRKSTRNSNVEEKRDNYKLRKKVNVTYNVISKTKKIKEIKIKKKNVKKETHTTQNGIAGKKWNQLKKKIEENVKIKGKNKTNQIA